jgi:hypothetical protein
MRKSLNPKPTPALGSVRRDEVLPLREAGKRLGWNRASITNARRDGLRTVRYGQYLLTTGEAIYEFIESRIRSAEASTKG